MADIRRSSIVRQAGGVLWPILAMAVEACGYPVGVGGGALEDTQSDLAVAEVVASEIADALPDVASAADSAADSVQGPDAATEVSPQLSDTAPADSAPDVLLPACQTASDCDDGNECTVDLCGADTCTHGPIAGVCAMSGCTSGVCAAGGCTITTFPDGTKCDECGEQVCGSGVCKHLVWYAERAGNPWLTLTTGLVVGGYEWADSVDCKSGLDLNVISDAGKSLANASLWAGLASYDQLDGVTFAATALTSGGAVVYSWEQVLHITPTGTLTSKTWPYFASELQGSSFGPMGAIPAPSGNYLVFGQCKKAIWPDPYEGADFGCATLRTGDDAKIWATLLPGDVTWGQQAEFDAAAPTSNGWLLGGWMRNASVMEIRPWLVWLSEDGTPTAQWTGPASDAGCEYKRILPWEDGWLIDLSCSTPPYFSHRRIGADGTVIGPLELPADVTQLHIELLPDGDRLFIGAWDKVSSRVVRTKANGERRWEALVPTGPGLVSQTAEAARASPDNSLDIYLRGIRDNTSGACGWLPAKIPDYSVQRMDAFGNSSCAATSGCAGRPMSDCDDKDPCTADGCSAGKCTHKSWADGTPCPGGKCASGQCKP